MFTPTTPITGQAQTGLVTPTYVIVADTPPDINAKQFVVTALGGTQAGVSVHAVSSPFTLAMFRPKIFRALGKPNPVTGVISNVPRNVYKLIVRKGMIPVAGQASQTALFSLSMEIPAGCDVASPAEIRGALSALFGLAVQQSAGIGDTAINGVL